MEWGYPWIDTLDYRDKVGMLVNIWWKKESNSISIALFGHKISIFNIKNFQIFLENCKLLIDIFTEQNLTFPKEINFP